MATRSPQTHYITHFCFINLLTSSILCFPTLYYDKKKQKKVKRQRKRTEDLDQLTHSPWLVHDVPQHPHRIIVAHVLKVHVVHLAGGTVGQR